MEQERYCRHCQSMMFCHLHRHNKASGAYDFVWLCPVCKRPVKSKTGGIWIAKVIVEEFLGDQVSILPVMNPSQGVICEKCGTKTGELHHWMPRSLSKDYHLWPTAYLCKPCHDEWHLIVTPKLGGK